MILPMEMGCGETLNQPKWSIILATIICPPMVAPSIVATPILGIRMTTDDTNMAPNIPPKKRYIGTCVKTLALGISVRRMRFINRRAIVPTRKLVNEA